MSEHTTSEDVGAPQILLEEVGDICVHDSQRWFPEIWNSLTHHSLALGGEVGEFLNVVKKIDRGSLGPIELTEDNEARQMLLDELTDVLIYTANLYGLLKGNPNLCFQAKRYHNEQRFGQGDNGGEENPLGPDHFADYDKAPDYSPSDDWD